MKKLDKTHVVKIGAVFLTISFFYMAQGGILTLMKNYLPAPKANTYGDLEKKAKVYISISKEINTSIEQQKKLKERLANADIISQVLYLKASDNNNKVGKKVDSFAEHWKVKVIFPEKNSALINSTIVTTGSVVDDAKVLQIKDNSVYLKTKKGSIWVYLFH